MQVMGWGVGEQIGDRIADFVANTSLGANDKLSYSEDEIST
jgi:hypothetical protein